MVDLWYTKGQGASDPLMLPYEFYGSWVQPQVPTLLMESRRPHYNPHTEYGGENWVWLDLRWVESRLDRERTLWSQEAS